MKYKKQMIAAGFAAAALATGAVAGVAGAEEAASRPARHVRHELTGEQEDAMDEIVALHEAGDHEAARELAKSVGLPPRPYGHHGLRGIGPENRAAVRDAVENDDFGAFEDAVRGSEFAARAGDNLDEAFEAIVESRELRESGDRAAAREKMESLRDLLGVGRGEE